MKPGNSEELMMKNSGSLGVGWSELGFRREEVWGISYSWIQANRPGWRFNHPARIHTYDEGPGFRATEASSAVCIYLPYFLF